MVAHPDRSEDLRPHGHCACGTCLEGLEARFGERRQQIEIPPPPVIVSQIFDCGNTAIEKRSIFHRRLLPLLELGREREGIDLSKVMLIVFCRPPAGHRGPEDHNRVI